MKYSIILFTFFVIFSSCFNLSDKSDKENDKTEFVENEKKELNKEDSLSDKEKNNFVLSEAIIGKTVVVHYNQTIQGYEVKVVWEEISNWCYYAITGNAEYYFTKENNTHTIKDINVLNFGLRIDFLNSLAKDFYRIENDSVFLNLDFGDYDAIKAQYDMEYKTESQPIYLLDYNFDGKKEIVLTDYCNGVKGISPSIVLDLKDGYFIPIFHIHGENPFDIDTVKQSISSFGMMMHSCGTETFFQNGKEACELNVCPYYEGENQTDIIGREYTLTIYPGFENQFELHKNGEKLDVLKFKNFDDKARIEVKRILPKITTESKIISLNLEVENLKKEIKSLKKIINSISSKEEGYRRYNDTDEEYLEFSL